MAIAQPGFKGLCFITRWALPEKDKEEAIRKAVDFSTTARLHTANWSGLPCEARFWDWKLGPAKAYYL